MQYKEDELPSIDSEWKHSNGNYYTVILITNIHSTDPVKYPVTVIYKGDNGRVWSRPMCDWHRSMKTFDPIERDLF